MRKPFPGFHAFTASYPGIVNRLITKANISEAYDPSGDAASFPTAIETDALWDTGATQFVITRKMVKALKLVPAGSTFVSHGGGKTKHDTFLVNLFLPNGVGFSGVMMTEMENVVDNFGIILGMDVIGSGDFAITNCQGKTCFSFRVPSTQKIDYVQEFKAKMKSAVGPNDTCHCGSGRKFKKCHGAR